MSLLNQEWIGLLAGSLTTISFIPQVLQVWRSRSARDISLGMYLIFVTGIILWLLYGVSLGDLPITVSNSITLVLACAIVAMKLVFDRRERRNASAVQNAR